LCAVDFGSHSHKTVSWAAQMAAEFDASLTLTHVTAGVELWGPGGNYVDERWKEALVGDASQHLAELKREMGLKASIFIGSGDVPKVLSHAAKQTKGGPVDYRESSLWRAPENPRLRDHLRNTDSDSERVRTARLCLITKSATVLRGPAVIREQIVRTGHLASLRINFTRFVFLPQRVRALVVLQ